MNEFVIQLDEEVEGMQATICALQEQLKVAKTHSDNLDQENQRLKKLAQDMPPTPPTPTTNCHVSSNGIFSMDHQRSVVIKEEETHHSPHQDYSVNHKDEFLDERTIHASSNGDSNMSNASDELPMELEPSITLPQQQNNLRTEDFQGNLDTPHLLPNHVTVIRGKDESTKDLETQLQSFKSPTKGIQKTSFSITDLLASSRTEPIKKDTDVPMDVTLGLNAEENGETIQHVSLNGEIDDSAV